LKRWLAPRLAACVIGSETEFSARPSGEVGGGPNCVAWVFWASACAAAAADPVEDVLEAAAPADAGADAEEREAEAEHDGEEDEHPLGALAQLAEEEGVLEALAAAVLVTAVVAMGVRRLPALRRCACHC
jgi:hypothetical protein